jgi:folate-binding protein YgfZ
MVPATAFSTRDQYDAARHHVAVLDRSGRGWIGVSGQDRASYLQGLLTNDIAALVAGQGCYAAYLTPQGRMISDLWVYELSDRILLALAGDAKDTVLSRLDQFIFTEDVTMQDLSSALACVTVLGPEAARIAGLVLEASAATRISNLPEHGNLRATFSSTPVIVLAVQDIGQPGYDLLIDPSHGPALKAAVVAAGAVEIDMSTAEVLRVESGIPKFHSDMDENTIPLEAGIELQAISFTKGCYVGQEVIVRVLHRGHGRVARKLVGLAIEGTEVPRPAIDIQVDGHTIGRITSSVFSQALARPIALGYVQRDFVAPGTRVVVGGDPAAVVALPFVPLQSTGSAAQ